MATSSTPIRLRLDPFCFRQFDDPTYAGTRFGDLSKDQFMAKLNEFVAYVGLALQGGNVCGGG